MGTEIFQIYDGKKAAQLYVTSDTEFTSVIRVQGHQRLNVGIAVGNIVSDLLSIAASAGKYYSAAVSAMDSVFSGTITLQRRMGEDTSDYLWRDVAEWAINSAAGDDGGSENITTTPEPESCYYRAGVKAAADYTDGVAIVRIGTS